MSIHEPQPPNHALVQMRDSLPLAINDRHTFEGVARTLLEITMAEERLTEMSDEYLGPARQLYDSDKARFGATRQVLKDASTRCRALLAEFLDRRVVEAAAEAKAAIEDGDMTALMTSMYTVPQVNGIGFQSRTSFEIDDLELIPDEFLKLELDQAACRKALKEGRDIPGVKQIRKSSVIVSTKKAAT